MVLTTVRKETSLRSSSTTKKTCLLQRSIKWLLGPRLGKTDRCCASSSKGKDRTKDVPATAIVLSTFQKDPLLTKLEYKIRAQNRTYVYVRFWASLMFFCLPIFCVPIVCLYVFLFVFSPWRRRKPFRLAKAGDQKPLDSAKQKASPFGGG